MIWTILMVIACIGIIFGIISFMVKILEIIYKMYKGIYIKKEYFVIEWIVIALSLSYLIFYCN